MLNRFTKEAGAVVEQALGVALELGAANVEAEHLLLAVARSDGPMAVVLRGQGLSPEDLQPALTAETERSLAAVGITAERPRFTPFGGTPRLATATKVALEQALRAASDRSDRHIGARHVVLGVLQARRGTVPRALTLAGVDQEALRSAISAV